MIPQRIYYVWFGKNKKPDNIRNNIQSWKKENPDFQIIEINESNFDVYKYKFTKKAYESQDWAYVSDVARIDILFNNGGFYLDTDVELIKSIEPLRNARSVWGLENSDAINTGLILGSEKGNKTLKELLDIYSKITFKHELKNHLVTVPIVTNYFLKHGFRKINRYQILENDAHVYPVEYFAPLHYWGGGKISKKTIAVHHYAGSWVENNIQWKKYNKEWVKKELILKVPSLFFKLKKMKQSLTS